MYQKVLIFIILLTFQVNLEFAHADLYSLSSLRKPPTKAELKFDRSHMLKYRGTKIYQVDQISAVRAMLGDEAASVDASLTAWAKIYGRGETPTLSHTQYAAQTFLQNKITSDYFTSDGVSIAFNESAGLTPLAAHHQALAVISDTLRSYDPRVVSSRYIDYQSFLNQKAGTGFYIDWPIMMLFSTIHIETATIYGDPDTASTRVLVIDEKDPRSLDLNYWNKFVNNTWTVTARPFVDKGEFLHPVTVLANEVSGYEIRGTIHPHYQIFRALPQDIQVAYYKFTHLGESYVAFLSGQQGNGQLGSSIIRTRNGEFFFGESRYTDAYEVLPKFPRASGERVGLLGIFKLCPKHRICKVPTEVFERFPQKLKVNPQLSYYQTIAGQEVNGKRIKLFFKDEALTADNYITSLPAN